MASTILYIEDNPDNMLLVQRALEARGYKRDPNYVDPGVDPDLAYRKDVAYQRQGSGALAKIFWTLVALAFLGWLFWFIFIRRIPYPQSQET